MTYPVNERFHTWQGEGLNHGRAAFFIRLHGCPVHCPWCDSAGTWHKDFIPKSILRLSAEQLVSEAVDSKAPLAVITGGEPCIHNLDPLIVALAGARIEVAIETCGAFDLPVSSLSCLTVSPKWAKSPTKKALLNASEWKIIVEDLDTVDRWEAAIKVILEGEPMPRIPIWLHPEWSKHTDAKILACITNRVKLDPRYRAGWQLHKNYKADSLDTRTQPLAPLGGNPSLGY